MSILALELVTLYPILPTASEYSFAGVSDFPTSFIRFSMAVWCCEDVHIQSPYLTPAMNMNFSPNAISIAAYGIGGVARFAGSWTVASPATEYQVLFSIDSAAQTYSLYVNGAIPSGTPVWGASGSIGWA